MPRGRTSGSVIRLGVLFLILIGVGIFGWNRRPDLVRNYLGVNAPARDTGQALQFANATLFGLATELTEAEVTTSLVAKNCAFWCGRNPFWTRGDPFREHVHFFKCCFMWVSSTIFA